MWLFSLGCLQNRPEYALRWSSLCNEPVKSVAFVSTDTVCIPWFVCSSQLTRPGTVHFKCMLQFQIQWNEYLASFFIKGAISQGDMVIPQPPRLHLSAETVDMSGAYLLDSGDVIYLYVGRNVHHAFLENVLGSPNFQSLPEQMVRHSKM